jgi:hypothetical protein
MGKVLKKIAPVALPILGTMVAPGIGTALSSSLSGATLSGIGGAVGGGLGGLASGKGIKGALTGAALGGAGGYLSGGGGLSGLVGGTKAGADTAFKSFLGGTGTASAANAAASRAGTGILGGLSSLTSGGSGGGLNGLSNIARIGGSVYGAGQEDEAAKKARKAMLGAIQPYSEMGLNAQKQLSGNLTSGFNPGDLTSDPSYQFRLKQGQDALNATLAAQGMGQSGAAMKAAQDYGQGFASTEYGNAYDRWLQQNSQLAGLGAQGLDTAAATGNVQGNYYQQQAEAKNKRIAEILSGLGYV